MKKFLKRLAIGLLVVIGVFGIAVSGLLWFVFTPARVTPVIAKELNKFVTCKTEIGSVELTFFSTFPRVGLKAKNIILLNPTEHAPTDTLFATQELIGVMDVKKYWQTKEIEANELYLSNGTAYAFIDSLGKTNFDILPKDDAPSSASSTPMTMDIKKVRLNNMTIHYTDALRKVNTSFYGLSGELSGELKNDSLALQVNLEQARASFTYERESYLQNARVSFQAPLSVSLTKSKIYFPSAHVSVNDVKADAQGTITNNEQNMDIQLSYQLSKISFAKLLTLVPPSYQSYLNDVKINGDVSAKGTASGLYSDTTYPLMTATISIDKTTIQHRAFPLPLKNLQGEFFVQTDLTNDAKSLCKITHASAQTPQSSFSLRGDVSRWFTNPHFILHVESEKIMLNEFQSFMPKNIKARVDGIVSGKIKSTFSLADVEKARWQNMNVMGDVKTHNLLIDLDTLSAKVNQASMQFSFPTKSTSLANAFLSSHVVADEAIIQTNKKQVLFFRKGDITCETTNWALASPDIFSSFSLDTLYAQADTLQIKSSFPQGKITLLNNKKSALDNFSIAFDCKQFFATAGSYTAQQAMTSVTATAKQWSNSPTIDFSYQGEALKATMKGQKMSAKKIQTTTHIEKNILAKETIDAWKPTGSLSLEEGNIDMKGYSYPFEIPTIQLNFSPEKISIADSRLKIENSDFSLRGTLTNILSYYKKDSLLRGDLLFASQQTDLLQLMTLTSGLGDESEKTKTSDSPYMVPKGIDVTMKTDVRKTLFGGEIARDIRGNVRVKDGILVLDGLQFTTPASKMQLTAMYQTPRKNHLYVGLDYHMLNIEIESLLKMLPNLDSIMPMLKSFRGKGEFHMATEVYLDSTYNVKKSTIRSAASVKGNDLVLLDGATFSEIAKKLFFNKKTQNKIDSLSAEFTVFKKEIDVYPFMLVMDKYKAVVAGRHNFDMSFNYNISVVKSPLPIKVCLDVSGTLDKLQYKVVKCQYGDLYRPSARYELQNRQLELRKFIRQSLLSRVKPQ